MTLPADVALEQDKRLPIFYLRSFRDDVTMAKVGESDVPLLPAFANEQEQLERALRRIGPVVGVAVTPKDQLPQVGFSPLHLTENEWRERVRDLMRKSTLVVLRIATTEGVLWEFQESPKVAPPERLLFLVPGRAEYKALLESTKNLLPFALTPYQEARRPPKSTVTAIIYFEPGWRAFLVPLQIPKWRGETLTAALIQAMQPVYEQIKVPWCPAPLSIWKVVLAGYGLLMVGLFAYFVLTSSSTESADPSQGWCSASGAGRAQLDANLSEAARARCCVKYPWLLNC